ncbi:hypothetical protein F0Q45_02440 [Mycobacterium simiae]|uniref:PE domain-containing protein n=1 Tax=Mycobacterium simiae TaxID=1784 RepID=A0A5B1BSU2_MYCSI|nr:hypothetical protein [Mycobacterium simiae]KAA1251747.1 hypothetical protein F0Q45_02440 [Mycobacterium simiae]
MTELLVVDPDCIESAGNKLQDLVLPVPRPQISATGTDPVSAAVNATMPIIESSVTDTLPTMQAALTRTGLDIATAAGMYVNTDRQLGELFGQVQFFGAGEDPVDRAMADRLASPASYRPIIAEKPIGLEPTQQAGGTVAQVGHIAPRLGQFGQTAGMAGFAAQSFTQSAQTAMASSPAGGPVPAEVATNGKPAGDSATSGIHDGYPEPFSEGNPPALQAMEVSATSI